MEKKFDFKEYINGCKEQSRKRRLFDWDDMHNVQGIYGIKNVTKNIWYIGEATNIAARWKLHSCSLLGDYHHVKQLQADYNDGDKLIAILIEKTSDLTEKNLKKLETDYMHKYIKNRIELYNQLIPKDPRKLVLNSHSIQDVK